MGNGNLSRSPEQGPTIHSCQPGSILSLLTRSPPQERGPGAAKRPGQATRPFWRGRGLEAAKETEPFFPTKFSSRGPEPFPGSAVCQRERSMERMGKVAEGQCSFKQGQQCSNLSIPMTLYNQRFNVQISKSKPAIKAELWFQSALLALGLRGG